MATFAGTFSAVTAVARGTKVEWDATTDVLPAGMLVYETDTGFMKIADGTTLYAALGYLISEVLTPTQKAYLEKAGTAGGVVILDGAGQVPLANLPSVVKNKVQFVENIAARDAIAEADRNGIVYVVDASADTSVTAGSATYGWNGTAWLKLSEFESMDLDFSDFFRMSVNTLDDIQDGATYVRMTATEKASLATLVSTAVRTGQTYNITALSPAAFTS